MGSLSVCHKSQKSLGWIWGAPLRWGKERGKRKEERVKGKEGKGRKGTKTPPFPKFWLWHWVYCRGNTDVEQRPCWEKSVAVSWPVSRTHQLMLLTMMTMTLPSWHHPMTSSEHPFHQTHTKNTLLITSVHKTIVSFYYYLVLFLVASVYLSVCLSVCAKTGKLWTRNWHDLVSLCVVVNHSSVVTF